MQPVRDHLRGIFLAPPLRALSARRRWLRRRWLAWRQYRKMCRFYAAFIGPGDLAFDVGANIGSRTRVFLELGASVVAVEPQKECVRHLFATYHAEPRFHLVDKALGPAEGMGEIYLANRSVATTMSQAWLQAEKPAAMRHFTWQAARPVTVTTLDALIRQYGVPAFTKIDAEGYDHEILRGLSRPLPALSYEFHAYHLGPALQSIAYLAQLGPIRLNYAIEERFEWMLDEWVPPDEMVQILERDGRSTDFMGGDVYVRFMDLGS